jgi:tRNA (guanine-N7-)-methyltransferase
MTMMMETRSYLSSFGRNRGRSLRPYQQGLIDDLLPTLAVNLDQPLAGLGAQVALEIGFGGGEHLQAQAIHNPHISFIGCEPYINGVAKLLTGIDQHNIKNIRLYAGDARLIVEALPDASLESVFILFPDPWPKARHNKRRLVNAETLKMLARVHKKGGRLLLATDHVDYSVWMLEVLLASDDYEWTAKEQADWNTPPADWTQTKYQRKTTEQGRLPLFFECVRK